MLIPGRYLDVDEDAKEPPMPPRSGDTTCADLVHDAALELAGRAGDASDRDRYLEVAVRMGIALEARTTRAIILAASPSLVERSGRVRSLVEMIEDEPGDDASRFRTAKLLMRALIWDPAHPSAAREAVQRNREMIRYQRQLIDRRLDELRRCRTRFQ
jgi:hypothetical protein